MWGFAGICRGLLEGAFAILRVLTGSGRVGRSARATVVFADAVAGDGGEEDASDEPESDELSRPSSICIVAFSASCSSSSACLRRWRGRSCAGVDFGRGGVSESSTWDLPGARAMGLRILPESDWRLRRAGTAEMTESPDMIAGGDESTKDEEEEFRRVDIIL